MDAWKRAGLVLVTVAVVFGLGWIGGGARARVSYERDLTELLVEHGLESAGDDVVGSIDRSLDEAQRAQSAVDRAIRAGRAIEARGRALADGALGDVGLVTEIARLFEQYVSLVRDLQASVGSDAGRASDTDP